MSDALEVISGIESHIAEANVLITDDSVCLISMGEVKTLKAEIEQLQAENIYMVTLLSGVAAGNNSRQDVAAYIKTIIDKDIQEQDNQ